MHSPVERAMKSYKGVHNDRDIITIPGHGFATGKFLNDLGKLEMLNMTVLLWGDDVWEAKRRARGGYKPNCVWAVIRVGNTHIHAGYDKETREAYKADGYTFTWEKWKKFEFVRFLRMQEL